MRIGWKRLASKGLLAASVFCLLAVPMAARPVRATEVQAPNATAEAKAHADAIAAVVELAKKDERDLTYLSVVLAACKILDPDVDPVKIGRKIDEIARKVKEAADGQPTAKGKIAAMNQILYGEYEFSTDKEAGASQVSGSGALDASLLNRVIDRKKGICLGLSTVYLVVAERAGLPVYPVHLPGHIFCRYDDGKTKVNIECTANGVEVPEAHIMKMTGSKPTVKTAPGTPYFRAVSKKEVLSDQLNNLSYDLASRKDGPAPLTSKQLVTMIDLAAKLQPTSHDILDSAGYVHFKDGNPVRALAYCDQATALAKEYGTVQEVMDAYVKRKADYEAAIKEKQAVGK